MTSRLVRVIGYTRQQVWQAVNRAGGADL